MNYRVIKHEFPLRKKGTNDKLHVILDTPWYGLHEVVLDDTGNIKGYSEALLWGSTVDEIRDRLKAMLYGLNSFPVEECFMA